MTIAHFATGVTRHELGIGPFVEIRCYSGGKVTQPRAHKALDRHQRHSTKSAPRAH